MPNEHFLYIYQLYHIISAISGLKLLLFVDADEYLDHIADGTGNTR